MRRLCLGLPLVLSIALGCASVASAAKVKYGVEPRDETLGNHRACLDVKQ